LYPISPSSGGYDRVATMFSPDGRLYQVEYASKIVEQGTLGVALTYKDGIIFGVDKKISSKLLIPESIEKLFMVDDHIGAVSAGLVGDARRLIQFAREKAQESVMHYDEEIKVESLVKEVSNVKQFFTQYGGMRPFGVSFIIGGVDESGKRLFETEPSGALAEYKAIAIGKGKAKAMDILSKEHYDGITFEKGVALLLKVIKSGFGEKEKFDYKRLEFAFIGETRKFKRIPSEKLKAYMEPSK